MTADAARKRSAVVPEPSGGTRDAVCGRVAHSRRWSRCRCRREGGVRWLIVSGLAITVAAVALAWSAAVPPVALAARCPGADVQFSPGRHGTISRTLHCVINQARVHRQRRPLRDSTLLARAGRAHARDMIRRRYYAHVSPSGVTILDRARRARYGAGRGYRIVLVGQVLGLGFTSLPGLPFTPQSLVSAWLRSPTHRAPLLSRRFRDVGTGAVFLRSGVDVLVLATNFGRRRPPRR